MSVAKNPKTGKWYCKFYYKDYTGKRMQKKKEGFAKKGEAQEWEKDFRARNEGKEQITFKQAYEMYIADGETRYKKMTTQFRKDRFKAYTALYDMPLTEITPTVIRRWQNEYLLQKDESGEQMLFRKNTIWGTNKQLSAFFNWACKFCGLDRNPVRNAGTLVVNKLLEKPKHERKIWKVEDFQRFIYSIERDDYHLIYSILFWCGLRRGEVLGLHYEDVDLEHAVLFVKRNVTPQGIDTPKTPTSTRQVSIPKVVLEELTDYVNKSFIHSSNQPLFDLSPVRITAAFLEFQRKIDMEPLIPLHCLRHSHASMLIDMGFGADVVGDRLGHKDASMVMQVYGHLYAERREEVVNKIDDMMKKKKLKSRKK